MKNLVFKMIGAFLLVEAVNKGTDAIDMVRNGSESRTAKSLGRMVDDVRERVHKRSKPDETRGASEGAGV